VSTCWTLIEGATAGDERSRAEFATRYLSVVRAYLVARWRGSALLESVDDAVQEFFVDCFRDDGALARLDPTRPGGFRPFLYGVVRNVARHVETRRARDREHPGDAEVDFEAVRSRESSLAEAFDRAWAVGIVQQALDLQRDRAAEAHDGALRRVDLLRLRFGEDLRIREVARRWDVDAARVHKEYAKARREFRAALLEVVAFHRPGSKEEIERHCADLLALIS
jgi:RNA polymerase sigma-70 factor (ECF subfamily)